jgi:hypothetical protein
LNPKEEFKVESNDMKTKDTTLGWVWKIRSAKEGLVAIYNPEEDFDSRDQVKEGNTIIIRTVDRYDQYMNDTEAEKLATKGIKSENSDFIN